MEQWARSVVIRQTFPKHHSPRTLVLSVSAGGCEAQGGQALPQLVLGSGTETAGLGGSCDRTQQWLLIVDQG